MKISAISILNFKNDFKNNFNKTSPISFQAYVPKDVFEKSPKEQKDSRIQDIKNNYLDPQDIYSIDKRAFSKDVIEATEFYAKKKDFAKIIELYTMQNQQGDTIAHRADEYIIEAMNEALKKHPQDLARIYQQENNKGQTPLFHATCGILARANEALKKQPEVLKNLYLHQDSEGSLVAHRISDYGIKHIHDALQSDPELIRKMHSTENKYKRLPIHGVEPIYLEEVLKVHPNPEEIMLPGKITQKNALIDAINHGPHQIKKYLEIFLPKHKTLLKDLIITSGIEGWNSKIINCKEIVPAFEDEPKILGEILKSSDLNGNSALNFMLANELGDIKYFRIIHEKVDKETLREAYKKTTFGYPIRDLGVQEEENALIHDAFDGHKEELIELYLTPDKNTGRIISHDKRLSLYEDVVDLMKNSEDSLRRLFLTTENEGNLPLDYEFSSSNVHRYEKNPIFEIFKDKPDLLKEIISTKNKNGLRSYQYLESKKPTEHFFRNMCEIFKDDNEFLKDILSRDIQRGKLPFLFVLNDDEDISKLYEIFKDDKVTLKRMNSLQRHVSFPINDSVLKLQKAYETFSDEPEFLANLLMQQPCYPHLKEKDYVQNFIETVIKVATNPELSIDRTLGLCYAHMHLDERIKAIHEYLMNS